MKCNRIISLLAVALSIAAHAADFPLRDVVIRDAMPVERAHFKPVPQGQEDDIDWSGPDQEAERQTWKELPLPHRWAGNKRQVGWYRLDIERPEGWDGDLSLCLLAAKFSTDIFVNGEYLDQHLGGYTPVHIPLGEGDRFEVLLRIDNRLRENTVPKTRVGWETYGGLDRDVWLLHLPPSRPEALDIRFTRLDGNGWKLHVHADWVGDETPGVTFSLYAGDEKLGSVTNRPLNGKLGITTAVDNPRLWHPEDPFLHRLEITWSGETFSMPLGIREFEWTDRHLLVNGEPLWLIGFGQHETEWATGKPLTAEGRERDIRNMKELFRINAIRAGHYPNHPHLYNLADDLGLLVFTEIPVWQSKGQILAQNDVWDLWLEPQLTDMVKTLRNHPSVFAWGVLNEAGAPAYMVRARKHIESLDPSRRIAAVLDKTRDLQASQRTNLLARNLHYGWYHSKSVYDLPKGIDINLKARNGHPLWIAEFGGLARPGRHGAGFSNQVRGTETYQAKMLRYGLQTALYRSEELAGISIWTWSDFTQGRGWTPHGILANDRSPKLAAYPVLNLMRPQERALALENRRVLPPGEVLTATFAIHRTEPAPGSARTFNWQFRRSEEVVVQGSESRNLAETRVTKAGSMSWTVPAEAVPELHHLYVELLDETGTRLHSQAIPIEVGATGKPALLRIAPPPDGKETWLKVEGMNLKCYPMVGLQLAVQPGEVTIDFPGKRVTVTAEQGRIHEVSWP